MISSDAYFAQKRQAHRDRQIREKAYEADQQQRREREAAEIAAEREARLSLSGEALEEAIDDVRRWVKVLTEVGYGDEEEEMLRQQQTAVRHLHFRCRRDRRHLATLIRLDVREKRRGEND